MPSPLTTTFFTLFFSTFYTTINGGFSEQITETISIKQMEKTTHLHFFFHDILGGKRPTAVKIAGTPDSNIGSFGTTMMIDDVLTENQESTSKIVGRAQGFYAVASQQDLALLMVVNYAFVEGKYNGSSISVLGRNPVGEDVREMPVVGGSGVFRNARGYALAHTVWFDSGTGDAIVQYNVYVSHY